jgi:cytochrome P450
MKWHAAGVGIDGSTLDTVDHDLHRRRRMALSGFFSTQSARRLQPTIQERVDALIARLSSFKGSDKVVPMNLAYSAWSNGRWFFGEISMPKFQCQGINFS